MKTGNSDFHPTVCIMLGSKKVQLKEPKGMDNQVLSASALANHKNPVDGH